MSRYAPIVFIGGAVLTYVGLPALVHDNVNPMVGGICSLATPNAWERMKCEIEAQQTAQPSPAPLPLQSPRFLAVPAPRATTSAGMSSTRIAMFGPGRWMDGSILSPNAP
jgi:hypothetical protein